MVLGFVLGLLLPAVDGWTDADVPLLKFQYGNSAAGMLQTIATVVLSVTGISFSIVVVALQQASQQLSPRVLRTFERDRLSKTVLGLFLGTFVYCVVVLAQLDPGPDTLQLSLTFALVLAMTSFAAFVVFIHAIVRLLQASTLIRRIQQDGEHAVVRHYPDDVGREPTDREEAERRTRRRMASADPIPIRAPRSGYLTGVDPSIVLGQATERDALVRQRTAIGDFVLTDSLLAEVWCEGDRDGLAAALSEAFAISHERTVVQDAAFPVRQLADVALKGLSPSLSDPTTAENAMGALADTLVHFAKRGGGVPLRADEAGDPRFLAIAPDLDSLVGLGFEQVRVHAAGYPTFNRRLLVLLDEVERAAAKAGAGRSEIARQRRLLRDGEEHATGLQADQAHAPAS